MLWHFLREKFQPLLFALSLGWFGAGDASSGAPVPVRASKPRTVSWDLSCPDVVTMP